MVGIAAVSSEDDLILISSAGKLIRVRVEGIRLSGPGASGVIIMRPEEGETLVDFQRVVNDTELAAVAAATEEMGEMIVAGEELPDLPETEEEDSAEEPINEN